MVVSENDGALRVDDDGAFRDDDDDGVLSYYIPFHKDAEKCKREREGEQSKHGLYPKQMASEAFDSIIVGREKKKGTGTRTWLIAHTGPNAIKYTQS
ncbi:hypothetical protein VNO77_13796 [Canavalia gladiata]|uniref:Uncharacterized protein n=1 Tax=Canavalia gladiata TaxID=3824 RepID=A0AAN9LYB9_CANGL